MKSTFTLCLALLCSFAMGQNKSPSQVCDLFLNTISVEQGEEVNWELLKQLCVEDVQFRSLQGDSISTLNFKELQEMSVYEKIGFREVAINREQVVFGSIASITEEFQAYIQSKNEQFEGINMYHLVQINGQWKITEVIYQVANEALPLPSKG